MCGNWKQTLLLAAFGVALVSGRLNAQNPPPEQPHLAGPERPGSSIETLEKLTGERVTAGAEGKEEIETDRDSFTPATTIAPLRRFIFEAAYSFVDNRGVKETHSFPEVLLRYGLTDRIELRLGWNADIGGAGSAISGSGSGAGHIAPRRSGRARILARLWVEIPRDRPEPLGAAQHRHRSGLYPDWGQRRNGNGNIVYHNVRGRLDLTEPLAI